MKVIMPFILLLLFANCDNQSSSNENDELSFNDSQALHLINEGIEEVLEDQGLPSIERQRMIDLLANPIDLENYKAEYGTSNSGAVTAHELFWLPDTAGFYYQYMLFHKLRNLLETHPSESDLFHNFRIIVYKYGESVGDFYATNEAFIGIECAMKNETLGELDLVGLEFNEIEDKFGVPNHIGSKQSFYFANRTVLALHFESEIDSANEHNKVTWFKIARVNKAFDLAQTIPAYLLSFE
ncbi:MAG: hypothetical protein ACI8ZM_005736 [Crocinitomix sp.]|jgi:hypothetical protein